MSLQYWKALSKNIKSQLGFVVIAMLMNWKALSKNIKSQLKIIDGLVTKHWKALSKNIKSQPDEANASEHRHWKALSKNIKSQLLPLPPMLLLTEKHYQRTSNHNTLARTLFCLQLKSIIKEHQITTCSLTSVCKPHWKALSKNIKSQPTDAGDSQIATEKHYQRTSNHNLIAIAVNKQTLKSIIKEHQITTKEGARAMYAHWKALSKNIKSQLAFVAVVLRVYWKALSKNIKSQRSFAIHPQSCTEKHYQRTSNHNKNGDRLSFVSTEKHYQRTSNHNLFAVVADGDALKSIIKEHQITTEVALPRLACDWKALSKNIKSQP